MAPKENNVDSVGISYDANVGNVAVAAAVNSNAMQIEITTTYPSHESSVHSATNINYLSVVGEEVDTIEQRETVQSLLADATQSTATGHKQHYSTSAKNCSNKKSPGILQRTTCNARLTDREEFVGNAPRTTNLGAVNSSFNRHLMKWKYLAEEGSGFLRVPVFFLALGLVGTSVATLLLDPQIMTAAKFVLEFLSCLTTFFICMLDG